MSEVAAPTVAPPDPVPAAQARWSRLWILTVVLAVLPIVVAVVRSVLDHWVPVGDDAYFVLRARDVWTSHIPLLGTWTSASLSTGRNINNFGPLFFDVLAIPVTAFGGAVGVAIGAGLINILSILGIAWCAFRRGGATLVALAMLVTGVLTWSMGSLLLFDPWQPHQLILPFLCYMFVAWSLACGDLPALPWAVGLASLLMQTHLTYVALVGGLSVWGVVGLVLHERRRRKLDPPPTDAGRRTLRTVGIAAAIGVVCWVQPLIEQVTQGGNMRAVLSSSSGSSGSPLGARHAAQVMANVLSVPPFWSRSGFDHAFTPAVGGPHAGPEGIGITSMPSVAVSVVSLAVLVAVVVGIGLLGRRRRDGVTGAAAVTALVGLVVGFVTAVRIPIDTFGVAAHQFRWLWPLGAFTTFAIVAGLVRAWTADATRRVTVAVVTLSVLLLVVTVANLPTHDAGAGPAGDRYAIPVVRAMDRQLAATKIRGPVLMDVHDLAFGDPYNGPLMSQLQDQGVPFVVDDPVLIRQLGPGRDAEGAGARQRIFSLTGPRADEYSGPGRRIAYHSGLSTAQRGELATLQDEIGSDARAGRIELNARGRQLVDAGELPGVATPAILRDPGPLLGSGALGTAYRARALSLSRPVAARVARYAELQRKLDRETVGVFLAPL